MKTQAPPPIKTVYYTDAQNDEFSSAQIEPRRIDESYRYIDPRPGWRAARFVAYRLFAMPAAFLYCKLALHARFENRQVLKAVGKTGCFVYGNHTQQVATRSCPIWRCSPKASI